MNFWNFLSGVKMSRPRLVALIGTISCTTLILFSGCKQNHYSTTITDAKVEAVSKRIELNGDEWAIQELRSILKSDTSHWRANVLLARLLAKDDANRPEVEKLLNRANPKSLTNRQQIQATFHVLSEMAELGLWSQALKRAEDLQKVSVKQKWAPEDQSDATKLLLQVKVGVIQSESKQAGPSATITKLEEFVAENPSFSAGRTYFGAMLREAGRYPEALEQFHTVIANEPDDLWLQCLATTGAAKTFMAQGDSAKAKDYARRARELGATAGAPNEFLDEHLKPIENL
jgi:tetratricopeptide (TPR) repeat protein